MTKIRTKSLHFPVLFSVLLAAILAILILTPAGVANSSTSATAQVQLAETHDEDVFKYETPSDWLPLDKQVLQEFESALPKVGEIAYTSGLYKGNKINPDAVMLLVRMEDEGITPNMRDPFFAALKEQSKSNSQLTVKDITKVSVDGIPAVEMKATSESAQGSNMVDMYFIFPADGGEMEIIAFVTPESSFDSSEALFDQIIKSVKLDR